ncbi:hypothetical protein MMSP_4337 [Mycobacterium sp. 012931]|nr:hypothetical protein MMSP_4337 [Mycobacterium sp. 012931]
MSPGYHEYRSVVGFTCWRDPDIESGRNPDDSLPRGFGESLVRF